MRISGFFAHSILVSILACTVSSSWAETATTNSSGTSNSSPAPTSNAAVEGFTEPYRDIDVAAAELGVLTQVHVKEGDRVKVGQLLAQLDDSVLQAALGIVKAEMEVEGRLESAQAELDLQTDLVTKLESLRDQKHASLQEVARGISQKKVLAARVKAVYEERTVKSFEMRRIERQLEQRKINAPMDGIVTRVLKEPGEFVSPSDPVAVKLVQLDPLSIVFSVPLAQLHTLSKGGKVNLLIDSSSRHEGEIEFISPTADAQSGTTRVRVKIANPGESIGCGLPCELLLSKKAK